MEGKISYVSMGQEVEGHQLIFNQLLIAARVSLKYKTKKGEPLGFPTARLHILWINA